MANNLGHDKIPQWTQDIWDAIDKAVADEHKLTAIASQFLTPPVIDNTMDGTVPADTVLVGDGGVLNYFTFELAALCKDKAAGGRTV